MHRATPNHSSFRAYVGGGARATIPEVDDTKLMQESMGNFMTNEARKAIEAPQNYGFTSVVADAMKDAQGKIQQCAETFMQFMGGNRSFPVMQNMDDRRHRLINLAKDAAKGATAMFGQKEWGQQFLNTDTGMFMTGNTEKKIRHQLVDNQNGKTQQQQKGAPALPRKFRSKFSGVEFDIETFIIDPLDAGSSGGSGGGQQGQSQGPTGQKTLHKEQSTTYTDMTKDAIQHVRGNGTVNVTDGKTLTQHGDDTKSTRCDSGHVHIRFSGSQIWVGSGGCFSSQPITLAGCNDSGLRENDQPLRGGPAAHFTAAPLSINNDGTMSLATRAPLKIAQPSEQEVSARFSAMQARRPMPHDNGYLFIDGVYQDGDDFYLGGEPGKHKFARIMTENGPSQNVWARID